MVLTYVVLVATLLGTAVCDYSCLCNYNVELGVLGEDHSSTIGYLYEFDCKPIIQDKTTSNYTAIAYEHKVGYVQTNNEIQLQMCPGDPSVDDIVTTQATTKQQTTTSTQATTMKQTTTTQATTVKPTTTMQATTMKPTTTTQATTIKPTTTTQATTIKPPTTTQATTTKPTTTTQASTIKPTTTSEATTMKPTTTTQATTIKPTTTTKATTTQPTTTEKSTITKRPTTIQPTTAKSTIQPVTTLSHVTLVNQGVCSQIVQEHARDDNNIVATHGHTCYEVMTHRQTTWQAAETDCKSRGGHLLSIASTDVQDFISELLSNNSFHYNLWIGLNDRNHEEHFEWVSGNAISFTYWLPGRKDSSSHGSEDCVIMMPSNNWKWDDAACSGILETDNRFVCQYRTVDPSSVVITTPSPTSDGNIKLCLTHNMNHAKQFGGTLAQYGHSCYELLPRTKYTWSHGESICHSHGGHLAHISSAAEQAFIQGFMTRHSPTHSVWIGLHDLGREGHFEWTSGNPVTYLNWSPGHMDNQGNHNVEDCVAFIPYEGGKWDDFHCGSQGLFDGDTGERHTLLCQYKTATNALVG